MVYYLIVSDLLPVDRENVGRCDCAEREKPIYRFVANSCKAALQGKVQVGSYAAKVDMRESER